MGNPGNLNIKVPGGKERKLDFQSSGERNGKSLNQSACILGLWTAISDWNDRRTILGKPAREGESPVIEIRKERAGSEVPRDTWNLAGSRGDHPPRLNTP